MVRAVALDLQEVVVVDVADSADEQVQKCELLSHAEVFNVKLFLKVFFVATLVEEFLELLNL